MIRVPSSVRAKPVVQVAALLLSPSLLLLAVGVLGVAAAAAQKHVDAPVALVLVRALQSTAKSPSPVVMWLRPSQEKPSPARQQLQNLHDS